MNVTQVKDAHPVGRNEKGADSKVVAKPIPRVETEAEQHAREARDRHRREELRKSKPELDFRQTKEETAYRLAKEEAAARVAKEQAAYRSAKAEFDAAKVEFEAARKLKVSVSLIKASEEENLKGDAKEANRLARAARERSEQVVKEFPGTVAARDAQEFLEGKAIIDRPLPTEPQAPTAVAEDRLPTERFPTERLTNLVRCVDLAFIEDWGSEVQQIPATVVDKGVLKYVPYQSFRAGDYEFNVYGDPDHPACLEIGVSKTLLKSETAKRRCLNFMASLLLDAGDRCLLKSLRLSQDIQKRGGLTLEVTPETADDAYGGWWVSVYDERALDISRATRQELDDITISKKTILQQKAQPGTPPIWTAADLQKARTIPGNAVSDDRVYVHGYTRKDGTYVQPYTRSAPGSGGRKK